MCCFIYPFCVDSEPIEMFMKNEETITSHASIRKRNKYHNRDFLYLSRFKKCARYQRWVMNDKTLEKSTKKSTWASKENENCMLN